MQPHCRQPRGITLEKMDHWWFVVSREFFLRKYVFFGCVVIFKNILVRKKTCDSIVGYRSR